ncbi:MAG: ArsR/SmtB family transcription factor [Spirochaetaceae bacterium]
MLLDALYNSLLVVTITHVRSQRSKEIARACKVLSVETRIRIIELLRRRPLCVNALTAHLGITQGAVSQHLRVMRDAGLVIDDREGYHVHYRLDTEQLARWLSLIDELLDAETAPDVPEERMRENL